MSLKATPLTLSLLALASGLLSAADNTAELTPTLAEEQVQDAAATTQMLFTVENSTDQELKPSLKWSLYRNGQYDDRAVPSKETISETAVASGALTATLPAQKKSELTLTSASPLVAGSYLVRVEYSAQNKPVVAWKRILVRPTDRVDQTRARRFGINGSEVQFAPELERCGFGWMRFENCKWQMYAPDRDHVAFDGTVAPWNVPMDSIFRTYGQRGMQVLPYVFQTPEWATKAGPEITRNRAGYPPNDPADYGEAIYQMVARYGHHQVAPETLTSNDHLTGLGLIQAVELWNEPNLVGPDWAPFVGQLDEYYQVMRAGVEGSRRADPKLPVSGCGWAGIDLDIVGTMNEHHYADGKTPLDLVDIINVHFYSGKQEPETCSWDPNVQRSGPSVAGDTYPEQVEDLVAWRDRLKPGAEIWLTETGNDVGGEIGLTERHQAAKVPRTIISALASGIDKVFIYREKGSTPSQHAGAGLLRNDGSIRAQWLTVATMIRQLQGFNGRAVRLPCPDPRAWVWLWQEGERRLITAWTTGDSIPLSMELKQATVTDAFGAIASVTSTAKLPIGYFPTYLSISGSPQLTQLVEAARLRDNKRSSERQRLAQLPMSLFDFGPATRLGMLHGYGPPRRFTAIGKDTLWSEQTGFGFVTPAAGEDNQHWIASPLDGDSCRLSPDTAFRFRLAKGKQHLHLSASNMNGKGITVNITGKGGPWSVTTNEHGQADLTLDGGEQDLELRLSDWGQLRWLSAMAEGDVRKP